MCHGGFWAHFCIKKACSPCKVCLFCYGLNSNQGVRDALLTLAVHHPVVRARMRKRSTQGGIGSLLLGAGQWGAVQVQPGQQRERGHSGPGSSGGFRDRCRRRGRAWWVDDFGCCFPCVVARLRSHNNGDRGTQPCPQASGQLGHSGTVRTGERDDDLRSAGRTGNLRERGRMRQRWRAVRRWHVSAG